MKFFHRKPSEYLFHKRAIKLSYENINFNVMRIAYGLKIVAYSAICNNFIAHTSKCKCNAEVATSSIDNS